VNISEINIEPIESQQGLIGWVSFLINSDIKVCNVAMYSCPKSSTGIRLVYPEREVMGKRFKTVYPVNNASYEVICGAVSNAYHELMGKLR